MKRYGIENLNHYFNKVSAFCLCLMLCVSASHAAVTSHYYFKQPEQSERFTHLTETLRCVVCQNQNLAESNADIANDMKQTIFKAISSGQTNEQILADMKSRYGNFILFSPPVNRHTFMLWFGPFILFLCGLLYVRRFFKA